MVRKAVTLVRITVNSTGDRDLSPCPRMSPSVPVSPYLKGIEIQAALTVVGKIQR